MPAQINISVRHFTNIFWEAVLSRTEEYENEKRQLIGALKDLEPLRLSADYNTGSISAAAAWCLYNMVRYFDATRAIEIGTFIGRSTVAMATAMNDKGCKGEIYTCDVSNKINIPRAGATQIFQFPKTTSTQMLSTLTGTFDFCFFDGRLADPDLDLLADKIDERSIIALDDFEGMEKGVINLTKLRTIPKLKHHFLVYPVPVDALRGMGFTGHSTIAALIPTSVIALTTQ